MAVTAVQLPSFAACPTHRRPRVGSKRVCPSCRAHGQFAIRLRDELRAAGYTLRSAGAAVGMTEASLSDMIRRKTLPHPETVARLSRLLDDEALVSLISIVRTRECALCQAPFVDNGSALKRRYCSKACLQTTHGRKRFDERRRQRAKHERVATFRLRGYQEAVDAYCRGCEPELVCRTGDCPLRAVSPLPFIPLNQVRKVA